MQMSAECVKTYDLRIDRFGNIIDDDDERPDLALDRVIRKYMAENNVTNYGEAFDAVMASGQHDALIRAYAMS